VSDEEREAFAEYWLKKCREPLESFSIVASAEAVAQFELLEILDDRCQGLLRLLDTQERERDSFLKEAAFGTSKPLAGLLTAVEGHAALSKPGSLGMPKVISELQDVLDRQASAHQSAHVVLERILATTRKFLPALIAPDRGGRRRTSTAFVRAVHTLAACMRRSSPNGEACWADVAKALDWFGHDMPGDYASSNKYARRLRDIEKRYRVATEPPR
jgi:hypothetical protein